MSLDVTTFAAILAMALVTYATRLVGIFLSARVNLSGRAAAAFDAIPPVVLVCVIAPSMLVTGKIETVASVITILAATRLPLLGVVGSGVASVVVMRLIFS